MTDEITSTTPVVCLDINLEGHLTHGRHSEPVETAEAPHDRKPVQDFTDLILPGHQVEFLGRTEMVDVWGVNAWGDKEDPNGTSLLFQTIHQCFAEHYPLALSPDMLWFMIMHEIATTVRLHPDTYRELFTEAAKGQTKLDVRDDTLVKGSEDNDWTLALGLIRTELDKLIPGHLSKWMLPKLSTMTPESEMACIVGLMDAASPFYDYHVYTKCGLPRIRMLGTVEDYEKIAKGAKTLAPLFREHLGPYFEALLPVLDKLVFETKSEFLDVGFWDSLYKFKSASGTDTFNGWITTFVNYVQTEKGIEPKPEKAYDWKVDEGGWGMPGIEHNTLPSHVSAVPFTWHYYSSEYTMVFFAGPLGVEVVDGFVTPQLSYGVAEKP